MTKYEKKLRNNLNLMAKGDIIDFLVWYDRLVTEKTDDDQCPPCVNEALDNDWPELSSYEETPKMAANWI